MTALEMHPLAGANITRYPLRSAIDRTGGGSLRRRMNACHSTLIWSVLFALLSWVGASSSMAQAVSNEQMRSLDEQVQEIKSDVLSIATELNRLEEKLLYPSNTQVALFVSLAEGQTVQIDSVQVQIDGELVAHHIYSFKELEALQKGGVQRIYTGNVATGEHQLDVSVVGKLPGGSDFNRTERFSFSKDVEPELVEISLSGANAGDTLIRLGAR
jgi:hypothetical protein